MRSYVPWCGPMQRLAWPGCHCQIALFMHIVIVIMMQPTIQSTCYIRNLPCHNACSQPDISLMSCRLHCSSYLWVTDPMYIQTNLAQICRTTDTVAMCTRPTSARAVQHSTSAPHTLCKLGCQRMCCTKLLALSLHIKLLPSPSLQTAPSGFS